MNNGRKIKVSGFKNCRTTTPVGEYFIDDILTGVKEGKWREKVELLRSLKDKNALTEAKTNLPCITTSGTFSQRNNKNLLKHSGLLCADLDNLDDVEKVKALIEKEPFVYAIFTSVSGNGLAVIVRIEPEMEKHLSTFEILKE